jgi:hypothetical protein
MPIVPPIPKPNSTPWLGPIRDRRLAKNKDPMNDKIPSSSELDDDILPEYDLSKIQFVRGKHAHRVGKPYTVTIHNGNGTATVQQFDGAGNMISERKNVPIGDS